MSIIKLEHISKSYGKGENLVIALEDINISINHGELVAIIGTSGSGKSTLLNILGFIDKPDCGKYYLNNTLINYDNNKLLAKYRNKFIGFVLQSFGLINSYTVFENVELPLIYSKCKNKKTKVSSTLGSLNILNKKDSFPNELSGGQQQRIAIARALINNPQIILADEPTGALDKNTANEVMNILLDLNKQGITIIIVTHDINIAKKCNRIIRLEDGAIYNDNR